ncbi:MAG: TIGR03118 family protein, partial [Terriglobia bacterium]
MRSICPSIFRAFSRLGGAACFLAAAAVFLAISPGLVHAQGYTQTNLVSDGFVPAAVTDPNLKNPWGLVQSSGSPFWASDQGADVSTLYKGNGAIVPLVVAIPTAATPPNGPTGIVFNGGSGFVVTSTSRTSPSLFLFADLNGSIYGWNGGAGNTLADVGATVTGGALTGLAINASQTNLYAANFTPTGGILEFDSAFKPVATTFTDASLPAGYEPYNVADINGTIFAAYEPMQAGRPLQGAGNGIIAEFNDSTGAFIKNLVGGGQLDDPWGMALAPADFGAFSND